jgi:subtilisin family serine protease
MAVNINEDDLPLEEFERLPTTVDFQAINNPIFKKFVETRPYLHLGTELANHYIVVYVNQANLWSTYEELGKDFASFFPRILSPVDAASNDATGITTVQNQPFLGLTGRGVILGFVDTGIDYTQNAFKFEDGSTKILGIWDQTIDGPRLATQYFGSTYDSQMINAALQSDTPRSIVPTVDEDGHGTFLASVAASNEAGNYMGAAPKANIVAVKLRRARDYYINRYLMPPDNPNLYEATDYLLGVKYVLDRALERNMPAVVCIAMGSNSSARDGVTPFEEYISFISQWTGYTFITAAGNEANAKHHTQGKINRSGETNTISIKVGRQGASFTVFLYSNAYDRITVGVTSPTGEVLPRVNFKPGLVYSEKLLLENTILTVIYSKNTDNQIVVGFQNTTEGIWDITLFGEIIISGNYYAWLPITGQVDETIEFLKPTPETTVVFPSSALKTITCGAYNTDDDSLYIASSWGPTRLPKIAPDFVAPGVNVQGIYPTGYGTMTGTSVAAAITAGAAALLLEWGVVQRNLPAMDGELVKSLLISGCVREENILFPNNKWGYGKLNLYNSITSLRETII